MKISQLMTRDPVTCLLTQNLAEAAALMLQGDCGILPVVDRGKLCGVVTDRDLFIALGTRDLRPSTVTIAEVMRGPLFSCNPDDDVEHVLGLMKAHAIRRVPVEGLGGTLLGIVSMNDIVRAIGKSKKSVAGGDVIVTLQSIAAHHRPARRVAAP